MHKASKIQTCYVCTFTKEFMKLTKARESITNFCCATWHIIESYPLFSCTIFWAHTSLLCINSLTSVSYSELHIVSSPHLSGWRRRQNVRTSNPERVFTFNRKGLLCHLISLFRSAAKDSINYIYCKRVIKTWAKIV